MNINELLEDRLISDPVKSFTATLLKVYEGGKNHRLLNKRTAEIGLFLLNSFPGLKIEKNNWVIIQPVYFGDERYRRLFDLLPEEGFQTAELKNLLEYFFGAEKAVYAASAWERIRFQMYQTGYARRSFRAPQNRDLYFINQLNFLIAAIPQTYLRGEYPGYKFKFYDLTISEQVKYDHLTNQYSLSKLWSAALDAGNEEIFRQFEDIIFNKDEIGKVTREIIKALLNSEKKEAWQLVEKLLLAAQRQEGLRQTILEALDETSFGALKYMINVIAVNKLTRFSSVVRAIDVWAGLGWESEREKTIKTFLEKASEYLEQPEKISEAVKSTNNTDVYMALWAQGAIDVEKTAPFLHELYERGDAGKRSLALKFAAETKHFQLSLPLYYKALDDSDVSVLAWALNGLNAQNYNSSSKKVENSEFSDVFEKLQQLVERVDGKDKTFDGRIFAWTRIVFSKNLALQAMIDRVGESGERLEIVLSYFGEMNVNLRQQLTRHILKDYAVYSWDKKKAKTPLTGFQHRYAFRLLSDKGEFMVNSAFNALDKASFSDEEMLELQNLLKRKGANFRGKIIALLLKQSDGKINGAAANLLANGDAEQRLAGLDILLQLKKANRANKTTGELVENFKDRKTISQKEEILLAQLEDSENAQNFSAANGYGLFDAKTGVSPIITPQPNPKNFYEKRISEEKSDANTFFGKVKNLFKPASVKNKYGFSMPVGGVQKTLQNLADLYLQNKDYEYEIENWDNTKQVVLLGNTFRNKKHNHKFETKAAQYADYPLPEIWEKWFQDSGLDAADLYLITLSKLPNYREMIPSYADVMPADFIKGFYHHNNPLLNIIDALRLVRPFAEKDEFALGGCTRLFASLDEKTLKTKSSEKNYYSYNRGDGWQSNNNYHTFYYQINAAEIDDKFVKDLWNLTHWRQFSGKDENIPFSFPSLITFCRAFELEIIGEDEMLRGLMTAENIRILSAKQLKNNEFDYFKRFPFLKPMFEKVREQLLDVELKRGDSATAVTPLAAGIQTVYGIKRFAEILIGLGKTPLNRGYSYYYNGEPSKQAIFSRFLRSCFPLANETSEKFSELMKKAKISETKLIEAAVYAPQWQKFISNYVSWKGLDSAIWWMHAHTKISGYQEQNVESESEIAKYSSVDLQDFKDGAVDKDWFIKALKEIGKTRWETVYDAAKYISDGNGHRRARLYADVISGKTKIKEITEKVRTKRDQDYLRMYGLAPLGKNNFEKDILARYTYLQKFRKESRAFGAQKQTSEALAIRVALENLARNAGYADPIRLTWAMETKQVQAILSAETEFRKEDFAVKLVIDNEGKAEIAAFKNDKPLKNILPKYKKEKKIIELNEYKKTLRDQFSRSRKGLEEAMVRGDEFEFAELQNLFAHPVISKHLKKLVFIADKSHGFYENGTLVSAGKTKTELGENDKIRLAHAVDLYESGEWSDYQKICFDNQIKQPFKQIFREFYTPTEDELKEKSVSRRYAGHQIQPKKTAALLKTRGWKADYEEGLQKVFHKEGFTAKMYALADWFSPAEVESPTLETVEFTSLKDYKNIAFETINPRIFSEVMRDIDLVVSVAHAGGVDPEASHSTIEMRAVLLRETLRLFKLENVEISGNHARVKGNLGEYSVHLGSAVVHKMPGKYLSILPVQSQHRGRIFLPFADDDPKSAEVMSKVLMLARDSEIQDPTILRQLN